MPPDDGISALGSALPRAHGVHARLVAPRRPIAIVFESTQSGVWQVHCWDRASGTKRQVTDHPVGVIDRRAHARRDAASCSGRTRPAARQGRWFVEPFEGGEARPFLQGIPQGWNQGLAQAAGGRGGAAISDRDGFAVFVSVDGAPAKELVRSTEAISLGGRRWMGSTVAGSRRTAHCCASSTPSTAICIHPALRVVDPRTGRRGRRAGRRRAWRCSAAGWSPDRRRPAPGGDPRTHRRDERPAMWDLATGELDRSAHRPGRASSRWATGGRDADALLLINLVEGRDRLFRYELADGALTPIEAPAGTVEHRARAARRTGVVPPVAGRPPGHGARRRRARGVAGRRRASPRGPAVRVVALRQR